MKKKLSRHVLSAMLLCVFVAGMTVYLGSVFRSAKEEEPIYAGEGVTEIRMLSQYLPILEKRKAEK